MRIGIRIFIVMVASILVFGNYLRGQSIIEVYPSSIQSKIEEYLQRSGYHIIIVTDSTTNKQIERRIYNEYYNIEEVIPFNSVNELLTNFGDEVVSINRIVDMGRKFYYDESQLLIAQVNIIEFDGEIKKDSVSFEYNEGLLSVRTHFLPPVNTNKCDEEFQFELITNYDYHETKLISETDTRRVMCPIEMDFGVECRIEYEWLNESNLVKNYYYFDNDEVISTSSYYEKYNNRGEIINTQWEEYEDKKGDWSRYTYKSNGYIYIESVKNGREPNYIMERLFFDKSGRLLKISSSDGMTLVLSYE